MESLRLVMAALQVATVRPTVGLSLFTDFENGTKFRPAEVQAQFAATLLDHVVAWSGAMRSLRPPQVDTATGTLTARAIFDNKDHALLAGLFVRVRVPFGHQDKALLTRDDAIGSSQEGSYVLVVGPDNVVQRKTVKTGSREGQLRIIESGLDPGDWVVTEGIQRAFPGAKVDPQRAASAPVAADPAAK